ncbi:MAG: hypothetical protein ACTSW1_13270 [Candidatus Hodarchaeales archaeon]
MLKVKEDKPILFFNTGDEDREAYLFIKSSGVPCEFRAPSMDLLTPLLLVGYKKVFGIDEIKSFISEQQIKIHEAKRK